MDRLKNVDVSVYQGNIKQKSCGTLQPNYGLEQTDQIYTLICNAEGDSVKLRKSTGLLELSEIVVTEVDRKFLGELLWKPQWLLKIKISPSLHHEKIISLCLPFK